MGAAYYLCPIDISDFDKLYNCVVLVLFHCVEGCMQKYITLALKVH